MADQNQRIRIESEAEVKAYLQKLRYALDHGAQVEVLIQRRVDKNRNPKYTNGYTLNKLFPGENPKDVLRIELRKLTVENYMQTVRDIRYPDRSEMREFGTTYNGCDDVYLKIRVELLGRYGKEEVLIMSFHFAEKPFDEHTFPYKEVRL